MVRRTDSWQTTFLNTAASARCRSGEDNWKPFPTVSPRPHQCLSQPIRGPIRPHLPFAICHLPYAAHRLMRRPPMPFRISHPPHPILSRWPKIRSSRPSPNSRAGCEQPLLCTAIAQFARRLRRSLTERRNREIREIRGIPSLAGFLSAYSAYSAVITPVAVLPLCALRGSAF